MVNPETVEQFKEIKVTATAIKIHGTGWLERPQVEEVFVLDWKAAGILIPWPEGMSPKEAIIEWAYRQAP